MLETNFNFYYYQIKVYIYQMKVPPFRAWGGVLGVVKGMVGGG